MTRAPHIPGCIPADYLARVRDAAAGRWTPEILTAVGGIPQEVLDGKHHPCPHCGGRDRFRLIDAEAGAVLCNQCFNERNGDGFSTLMWLTGVDFPEAVRRVGNYLGIPSTNGHNGHHADPLDAFCRSKRVPRDSAIAYGATVAGDAVEFPSWYPDGTPASTFTVKPSSTSDKQRKGLWPKGGKAGLFLPVVDGKARLPTAGETWHILEGVKDAAALHGLGYLAVGLPTCQMSTKFAKGFRGAHVVLAPDLDSAGQDGADKTAARLYRLAASVRIARLPGEIVASDGKDVRDILAMPDGEQLVREAIEQATEWTPPKQDVDLSDHNNPLVLAIAAGRTEAANAKRLIDQHGRDAHWCDPWSKWLVWDGKRWAVDDQRRICTLAKLVAADLWREAGDLSAKAEDDNEIRAMLSFVKSSNGATGIRNMIDLARSEPGIPILATALDTDHWLLNVANGTLDLRTTKLRPHERGDFITKLSPVSYDIDAECPTWRQFLQRILPDETLRNYVRRLAGYCLTGAIREHVLPICWGTGANGKSTLLDVLLELLGDYAAKAPSDLLLAQRDDTHPTALADLHGKRLVTCVETGDGRRLAETLVKEMTGGDRITARRMREDYWTFTATHKLILATNHKPTVRGTDYAVWRRLKLIPFAVTIPEAEQDRSLKDKLLAELPGILNWALLGCVDWQANGLGEPDVIRNATESYRDEMDVVGAFIAECCLLGRQHEATATSLFQAYRDWCERNGEYPTNQRRFGMQLTERGIEAKRGTGGRTIRVGVGLRE